MRTGFIGNLTADLLFPRRCPVCMRPVKAGLLLCPECDRKLPRIRGPRCEKCSKPVEEWGTLCDDCRKKSRAYESGRAAFLYDDVMREVIASFKYRGRREIGIPLGRLVFDETEEYIRETDPEVLVPIPIHRKRLRRRTFNQAEEIAREVARASGIPVNASILQRSRETDVMKRLSASGRSENLRGAFVTAEGGGVPKRVLLVDDIYTTGSTVGAAAEALLAAGSESVSFLTVCIGSGFMVRY